MPVQTASHRSARARYEGDGNLVSRLSANVRALPDSQLLHIPSPFLSVRERLEWAFPHGPGEHVHDTIVSETSESGDRSRHTSRATPHATFLNKASAAYDPWSRYFISRSGP